MSSLVWEIIPQVKLFIVFVATKIANRICENYVGKHVLDQVDVYFYTAAIYPIYNASDSGANRFGLNINLIFICIIKLVPAYFISDVFRMFFCDVQLNCAAAVMILLVVLLDDMYVFFIPSREIFKICPLPSFSDFTETHMRDFCKTHPQIRSFRRKIHACVWKILKVLRHCLFLDYLKLGR